MLYSKMLCFLHMCNSSHCPAGIVHRTWTPDIQRREILLQMGAYWVILLCQDTRQFLVSDIGSLRMYSCPGSPPRTWTHPWYPCPRPVMGTFPGLVKWHWITLNLYLTLLKDTFVVFEWKVITKGYWSQNRSHKCYF